MPVDHALEIKDDREPSDLLRDLDFAPGWIKAWRGPFRIVLAESIAAYFKPEGCTPEKP